MNIRDDGILSEIRSGYLVGGAIRDFLQGKPVYDRDIAIKDAENFAKNLSSDLNGKFIVLDEVNKIYRVVLSDRESYFDVSELQGDSIEEDLIRRDFTINAVAYDLKNDKIIDTTGGINDLKNGIIRQIREENFKDDPLRVLRAFRFMAVTGFETDKNTETSLHKYRNLINKPAKERVTYEIMKLFGGEYTSKTLLKMDEIGILELLFPQINEMKKIPPNLHHHLNLFLHSIETVRQVENLYSELLPEAKKHMDKTDFGGFPRINHLKLSAFLHDIGKFSTWTIDSSGRHRFITHDEVGAKLAEKFLQEMKFSKKQISYISDMIKKHIYPSGVVSAPDLNEKVMMRYIRKAGDNAIDNIILAKADRLSARGVEVTEEMVENNLNGLNILMNFYLEKKDTLKPVPKLLDGTEIMSITGLGQGKELGILINALKEAQINGDITNYEEAVCFVKTYKINK